MNALPDSLAELIASRMCHDLISPIGAIGNGIELLLLAGQAESPEFSLLDESARMAAARIRLFRLAFGQARSGQIVTRGDITLLFDALSRDKRLTFDARQAGDLSRPEAKLMCLLLLCLESAMPRGGHAQLVREGGGWQFNATGPAVNLQAPLWSVFSGVEIDPEPGTVHFTLAARQARLINRQVTVESTQDSVVLRL